MYSLPVKLPQSTKTHRTRGNLMIGEYSVSEQTNDFAQIYLGTDSYIATTLYATSFQVGAILTTMPL